MAELSNLKPIQTKYKGYHFRSRLEARWAVFFDGMGLDWTYEVEGYQLKKSYNGYLPDFLVKGHKAGWNYYYEIKPKWSDECPKVEEFKSILLGEETFNDYAVEPYFRGAQIHQLNGDPLDCITGICPRCKLINSFDWIIFNNLSDSYYCENCDISKMKYDCFVEENACKIGDSYYDLSWHKGQIRIGNGYESDWFGPHINIINEAAIKAREARFDGSDF